MYAIRSYYVGDITVFEPRLSEGRREALYAGWKRAVERSLAWVV